MVDSFALAVSFGFRGMIPDDIVVNRISNSVVFRPDLEALGAEFLDLWIEAPGTDSILPD